MSAAVEAPRAAEITRLPSWTERNRAWLLMALARLRQRIESAIATGAADRSDCVAAIEAKGFTPALVHCARVFGLSAFERELLLLTAGLELDQKLRAAIATANSGASTRASFGRALALLTEPHWDALAPDAALRRWRIITPEPGAHLTEAALRLDERILHFLAGVAATDAVLAGIAHEISAERPDHDCDRTLVERIGAAIMLPGECGPIVVLQGDDQQRAAQRDLALGVASCLARRALWIEARDLPADPDALLLLATHIDRESALSGVLPVLATDERSGDAASLGLAARLRSPLIWLGPASPGLTALPRPGKLLRFSVPAKDRAQTKATLLARWRDAAPPLAGDDAAIAAALERAGAQFHLDPAAIDGVVAHLRTVAPIERARSVWPAAREASRGGLDTIAQRIVTRAGFDDLVLPAGHTAMLRDIARHLRHRERVFGDWGFGAKHQLGQGLVALFAGESGTGKTLAAEAIANAVDLDLYRVDLAMLVSKYIGETEKNLKRLFDAAEKSGAVLLFDEADALFGKRSEVKDSHDRYANIEVAYLLQRVEAYRGLAILTTNMKSALDRAFLRRIRFVVNFPFPDAAAREAIWRRQLPPGAPLGEIDYPALARLTLAGGNIRNVAVSAAFKAADAGARIGQELLMTAAREEFAKLERSISAMGGSA